jgi:hypothetical protein
VQLPLLHDAEQAEPDAHIVGQSPLVQVTLHVPPAGQVVLQLPLEQLTLQGPEPHVLVQSTPLQERVQDPVAGQVELQSALLHEQLPLVHVQLPPSHGVGVPELLEPLVLPDDPQAGATSTSANVTEKAKRMSVALPRVAVRVQPCSPHLRKGAYPPPAPESSEACRVMHRPPPEPTTQ